MQASTYKLWNSASLATTILGLGTYKLAHAHFERVQASTYQLWNNASFATIIFAQLMGQVSI